MQPEFDYEAVLTSWVSILGIDETVYKCVVNTSTTAHGQKNMSTQRTLDVEKVREFVGDFNKLFKDLKAWTNDAEQIKTWRKHFLETYPEIFDDSSENEVEMETEVESRPTTMETEVEGKPDINREEKLREIEEKLLSKRTVERFTNYEGVTKDPNLTRAEKIIYFQKAIDDATRRKIHWASLQGGLLEKCFHQSKEVYEKTLVGTKVTRQWARFLRKLHKLVLKYNQLQYCTIPLHYIHSTFKIIEEICERDQEKWN